MTSPPHQHEAPAAPPATRASIALPDQAAVDRHGIDLPVAQARIVYCVLSHLIGESRSKTRVELHAAISGVVWMMRTCFERFGETWPAPYPDLPLTGWPGGTTGFRTAGTTYHELEETWRDVRDRADDAALPVEWVLAFIPAALWPAVWTLITWGPDTTRVRMEAAMRLMARQPTQRPKRRRAPGATISRGTIINRISATWRLLAAIIALRSHIASAGTPALDPAPLAAWVSKPVRPDPRQEHIADSDQNNHGPAIEDAARRLRELAMDALPSTSRYRYRRLRRLLLFSIHALYGARADAVRNLRVCDYLRRFQWNDGTIAPALRIYPGKTWARTTPHHLPIPEELAAWLDDWLTLTGRTPGDSPEPLFPNKRPRPGIQPGFLSQLGHYNAVAGTKTSLALMPKAGDPHQGWHPHAFRHLAVKLAAHAAAACKETSPGRFAHIHPDEFARAVVGHKLGQDVTSIYRDLDRQELCRAVIPEMWRILYADGALRRGPDPARVRAAREHRDALLATITALRLDIHTKQSEAEALADRGAAHRDPTRQVALLLHATQLSTTARGHRDDLDRLHTELRAAEQHLTLALETLVPIPSDLTDDDHADLLRHALGQDEAQPVPGPTARASELTVQDAADLFAVTPQAINRWIRHGPPPTRPAPWQAHAWRVITPKEKRLRVDHLIHEHLTNDQRHRLDRLQERRAQANAR